MTAAREGAGVHQPLCQVVRCEPQALLCVPAHGFSLAGGSVCTEVPREAPSSCQLGARPWGLR